MNQMQAPNCGVGKLLCSRTNTRQETNERKLTKKQVDQMFVQEVMPAIRKLEAQYKTGKVTRDIPMRCAEYNNFVDSLLQDRQITGKQAATFCIPTYLIK